MRLSTIYKAGTMTYQRHQLPSASEESTPFPAPSEALKTAVSPEHEQGFSSGFEQGLHQAREEGYDNGYRQGLEAGRLQGVKEGHEQGLKQGIEQGYGQGKEQGFQDGRAEGEVELQKVLSNLDMNLKNIQQYYGTRKQELSYWLSALIEEISRQVIRTELKLQPQQIMSVVQETIQHLPDDNQQLTVHMHPEDVSQLRRVQPDFSGAWTLLEDENVPQGDCRVISEQAEATASVEERLAACMEIVKENLPEELDRSLA